MPSEFRRMRFPLDFIHICICILDELKKLISISRIPFRPADAQQDIPARNGGVGKNKCLFLIRIIVCVQYEKFISSIPIAAAAGEHFLQTFPGFMKYVISRQMSIDVIDFLEIIDVDHISGHMPM